VDDYALAISAAIITATVIILSMLLWRYHELVKDAHVSSTLAKDVWDSVASRFSVVDARIIDLMVKTEVLSSRSVLGLPHMTSQKHVASNDLTTDSSRFLARERENVVTVQQRAAVGEGTETETKVLLLLAKGPKTSAQIKDDLGRSREHTARLMKALFDRGLVVRNARNKPYVYEITESGKTYVAS